MMGFSHLLPAGKIHREGPPSLPPALGAAPARIEKPAPSLRIALDVSKQNGINISPTRYFGSFVPEHLFQTKGRTFHPWKTETGEIPRTIGDSGSIGAAGHQVEET
jgi:hypothetical protein